MVHEDFRQQHVGTAMLKMIMNHKEYHDRKVMLVTYLNHIYKSVVPNEIFAPFYSKFKFEGNKIQSKYFKYKKGDNDVDNLVLKGSEVECTDHSNIMSAKCHLADYDKAYGYYEIDNDRKYSICVNPHDNCLYGKSAHYRWDKIDTDDEIYIPATRINLARKHIGCEIRLTASGSRKTNETTASSLKRSFASIPEGLDSIPNMFKQSTYQNSHGCVWLSASMLLNSVNSDVGMKMAQCYAEDQDRKQYEWLDIFPNKRRSDMNTMIIQRGSLVQKLQQLRGNGYQVAKIKLTNDSKNLTDLLLKEKTEGLFVVILEDTDGIQSHAVGIDVGKKIIYDCMEDKTLPFNVENLSICCGSDAVFLKLKLGCELKPIVKRPKQFKKK